MANIPLDGQIPFEVLKYMRDPGLIAIDVEALTKQSTTTAGESAKLAKAAADDAVKSAENMTSAAIQTANATKIRIEAVLSAILSGSLTNPLAGI